MNIDDLTIGDARKLAAIFSNHSSRARAGIAEVEEMAATAVTSLDEQLADIDRRLTELAARRVAEERRDHSSTAATAPHPMLGRRCLIRTFSAGVHIGDVATVNGMEVLLKNALRLWKWEGGGLSLSAVATNGIKGGRLNRTPEIYLTNAVELIPTTPTAEASYVGFIED